MIKELFATPLIKLGIKLLDDSIPVEKVQAFIWENLSKLTHARKKNPNQFSFKDLQKIEVASALYKASQNSLENSKFDIPFFPISSLSKDNVIAWIEDMPRKNVISFKGILPGVGDVLLWLYENPSPELAEFFETQLEILLRIIEVRRKKAINYKRHKKGYVLENDHNALSILFSMIARDRQDLRFLNTALKLNDWVYPKFQKVTLAPGSIDYLLALAEAELTCMELLS